MKLDQLLSDLTEALSDRLSIIGDETSRRDPVAHTERLRLASERLERIEQQLPRETDPQLRHFLQRRSYSKALDYIKSLARNL